VGGIDLLRTALSIVNISKNSDNRLEIPKGRIQIVVISDKVPGIIIYARRHPSGGLPLGSSPETEQEIERLVGAHGVLPRLAMSGEAGISLN
jgi:hypothetical protein